MTNTTTSEPTIHVRHPPSPTTATVAHPASTIFGQRLDQQAAVADQAGLPFSAAAAPERRLTHSRVRLQLAALFAGVIAVAALVGAAAALLLRSRG